MDRFVETLTVANDRAPAEIDPSLSMSGWAADAKATGDRIRTLESTTADLGADVSAALAEAASAQGSAAAIDGRLGDIPVGKTAAGMITENSEAVKALQEKASPSAAEVASSIAAALADAIGELPEGTNVAQNLEMIRELASESGINQPGNMNSFVAARTYVVENSGVAVFRVEYTGEDAKAPDTGSGRHVYNCIAFGDQNRRTLLAADVLNGGLAVCSYIDTEWKDWQGTATKAYVDSRVGGLQATYILSGVRSIIPDSSGKATINFDKHPGTVPTSVVCQTSAGAQRLISQVVRRVGSFEVTTRKTDGAVNTDNVDLCWVAIWN